MKLKIMSRNEYMHKMLQWHLCYALLPKEIDDGEWRWLTWVERRLVARASDGRLQTQYRDSEHSLAGWPRFGSAFGDSFRLVVRPHHKNCVDGHRVV